ncbi:MAG: hypothetical protein ACYS8Z_22190 [Planctomycetota bacterium]
MNQDIEERGKERIAQAAADEKPKLPASAHVMCGWPLLLVFIGGAIGGGLGGAAYAINLAVYKSKLPVAAKVVLNIVAGLAAIIIWFVAAMAIQSRFGQ